MFLRKPPVVLGALLIRKLSILKEQEFLIIPPRKNFASASFPTVCVDQTLHSELLDGIDTVRQQALKETSGAVSKAAHAHLQALDAESWHVVLRDAKERVLGCARYRQIDGGCEEFRAAESALARSVRFGPIVRSSLDRLIAAVRRQGKQYGEAGGWALRPEARGTTAGVNIALMTYGLAERLGSGLAVTTATRLNQSASMLRRIGARRLAGLPGYYEPKFSSVMEIVHFDIPCLNALYASRMRLMREALRDIRVVAPIQSYAC